MVTLGAVTGSVFKVGRESADGVDRSFAGGGEARAVKPCYPVTFAAGIQSNCPGTVCEAGREMPRNFQCLSKVSNVSNQD